MLALLLIISISIAIGFISTKYEIKHSKENNKVKDRKLIVHSVLLYSVITLFLIASILLLIFGITSVNVKKTVVKEDKSTQIVSLSLGSGIQGDFFLSSGSINGENYYYFYTKDGNKYKLNKLNAEDVYIEESNTPRLETKTTARITTQVPGKLERLLGWKISNTEWTEDRSLSSLFNNGEKTENILYIPKGSLKEGFSADVSNLK